MYEHLGLEHVGLVSRNDNLSITPRSDNIESEVGDEYDEYEEHEGGEEAGDGEEGKDKNLPMHEALLYLRDPNCHGSARLEPR